MTLTLLAVILGLAAPAGAVPSAQVEGPLASVRALRCSFPVYAAGRWVGLSPEVLADQQEFSFEIEAIDHRRGRATIVGSGTALATMLVTRTGMNIIEQTPIGNLTVTTIFAAGGDGRTFLATHSRHLGDVSAPPGASQSYGTCEIVR